jgi:hypothetical protein
LILTALVISGQHAIAAQSEMVIAREGVGQGEKNYHRPGCPVVRDGKGVVAMARAEAESRGFKAHRDCDPALSAPAAPQGATVPTLRKAPPETVFIDTAATHYHRKDCAKLGAGAKAVAVTDVGKRWPCPTCRPPVPKRTADPVVPRWRGPGRRGGAPVVPETPPALPSSSSVPG